MAQGQISFGILDGKGMFACEHQRTLVMTSIMHQGTLVITNNTSRNTGYDQ